LFASVGEKRGAKLIKEGRKTSCIKRGQADKRRRVSYIKKSQPENCD